MLQIPLIRTVLIPSDACFEVVDGWMDEAPLNKEREINQLPHLYIHVHAAP